MGLVRTVAPTGNPVITDSEAQAHCKVDSNDDLTILQLYRDAAVDAVEKHLRRVLLSSTWEYSLETFPYDSINRRNRPIVLPVLPIPLTDNVQSITYLDEDGTQRTLSSLSYKVYPRLKPAEIRILNSDTWPGIYPEGGENIVVTFKAGYANAAAVPAAIRAGILLKLGSLYANRETTVTGTISTELSELELSLLSPYVLRWNG